MDLFDKGHAAKRALENSVPLAARLRPRGLDEIVGQRHILGAGCLLRRAIEADRVQSLILFGPPGCGKTSIAEAIAIVTRRRFERTSGVLANVAVLRDLLTSARLRRERDGLRTILFIDEIHHFNRSQQDLLLPYVEDGVITLIGATTHNPFFFITAPLTSRSQVFELEPLSEADILDLLHRALADPRSLPPAPVTADEDALAHLAAVCEGDARRALTALEIAFSTTPGESAGGRIHLTLAVAEASIQKKAVVYDRDEDGHHDTISAFIKSVRGSDPQAAVYWLAKMLEAGEDPRFIVRRLIVLASEDIGNADPRGLSMAVAALQAVEFVGMPEARIVLAQATTYLATAPKSNAAYLAVDKALDDLRTGRVLPVPRALRNADYKGAARLGHKGYIYPHDHPGHFVAQSYAPTAAVYYEPSQEGYEATIAARMAHWDKLRADAADADDRSGKPGGGTPC
ncbi:MAG: replication-associated recombination protein A [Kiritimatiellia bacterium]